MVNSEPMRKHVVMVLAPSDSSPRSPVNSSASGTTGNTAA
jgi:hypothetical protein